MKLYEQGVYLLRGTELVANGPQAQDEIRQKDGTRSHKGRSSQADDGIWYLREP